MVAKVFVSADRFAKKIRKIQKTDFCNILLSCPRHKIIRKALTG